METGNRIESFKGVVSSLFLEGFPYRVSEKHWEHNISYHWYPCCPGAWKFQRQTQRIWNTSPFPMMLYIFQSKLQWFNALAQVIWVASAFIYTFLKFRHPTSFKTSCIYQARAAPSRGLTRTSWAPTLSGDFCWWAVACRCDKSLGSEDLVKTTSW